MKRVIVFIIIVLLLSGCNKKDIDEESNTKYYDNGTIIYFDPISNKQCNEEDEQCLKWYVINDAEGNKNIKLLLSYNILEMSSYDSLDLELTKKVLKWHASFKVKILNLSDIEKLLNIKVDKKGIVIDTEYKWLYENSESQGYWLNNEDSNIYAWVINKKGIITTNKKNNVNRYGIRPYIEVNKNIIK